MLKKHFSISIALLFSLTFLSVSAETSEKEGLLAKLHTNHGPITARLFYQQAPLTVMNFVGLAEGTIAWTNPTTDKQETKPLYQNLTFHHARSFMVQTGDPSGKGTGGPGFVFADEFHPDLHHNKPGILSMANRGPNTNGSQFFITLKPTEWLDNHHTIFGEVIEGLDIVAKIVRGDQLTHIDILRVGADAKAFDAKQAHDFAHRNQQTLREVTKKVLPKELGPLDATKVPGPDQPMVSPGNFDFIVIGHTGMRFHPPGKMFYYDHPAALAFAKQLVRHARSKNVDFETLRKKYSDMDRDTRTHNVTEEGMPAPMKSIFHLKPGQISEPIDSPMGIYIFYRMNPMMNNVE
jgi:cyclophilin family peptidyl-prolyl cis-trans isomerase